MVQDMRRIILSEEELVSAIESYRRMTPSFLPEGTVKTCAPSDAHVSVTLQVPAGNSTNDVELKLSCADLLKPLIRFCLENNIILPRDGKKVALISQGQVILGITLDLNVDCSEFISPMRLSHLANLSPADLMPKMAKGTAG